MIYNDQYHIIPNLHFANRFLFHASYHNERYHFKFKITGTI